MTPAGRRSRAALLLILLVALALRTCNLGGEGLSSDEAFSWRLTRYEPVETVRRTAADVHPPLYYLLLGPWTRLAGASPWGLRSLSVILGLLGVLAVRGAVREHGRLLPAPGGSSRGAPLLAALLAGLHLAQVAPARSGRMYALGVFLAAATSLLLLRALRRGGGRRWLAYGLAAAAFLYTHYYAPFTLLAQGLWAATFVSGRIRSGRRAEARAALAGLGGATLLAVAAFLPWLPALRSQARSVWADYWISPLTIRSVTASLAEWAAGAPGSDAAWPWLLGLGAVTAWALWRSRQRPVFFALQAALPWLAGLALSLGQRSVFLTRYAAFAHVGLVGLWALAVCGLPRSRERQVLALLLAVVSLQGTVRALRAEARGEPAEEMAGRYLARHATPGDLVLVQSPWRLNRLLYYASRAGAPVDLRCVLSREAAGRGHLPHLSSLRPGEVVWEDEQGSLPGRRLWWGALSGPWPGAPPGWRAVVSRSFVGGGRTTYALTRYRREE